MVYTAVGLSVFPDDVSKTNATKIIKLDMQIMFHDESWKPIYCAVKVTSQKDMAGVDLCTLVSAGLF